MSNQNCGHCYNRGCWYCEPSIRAAESMAASVARMGELGDLRQELDECQVELASTRGQLTDERRKVERFVAERDREFERANKLSRRVQELEAQRNEVKLLAQKRITDAMGKYGEDWSGDWLDEACDRLTRKRMLTKSELAVAIGRAFVDDDSARAVADLVCNMLGVTLRE